MSGRGKVRDESARQLRLIAQLRELYKGLAWHIDDVFQKHRLAYAFKDVDNADGGKVPTVFVCICKDGFERQGFNAHMREKLRAPFMAFLGEKETELKELVDG